MVPSEDLDITDVSSTCTTQLAPGGIGAPVLIRAHFFSLIFSWQLGYKIFVIIWKKQRSTISTMFNKYK